MNDKVTIYTDGAARGNPGRAGWAAVILKENKIFEIGGYSSHATNNQMELMGAISGLKYLRNINLNKNSNVEIFSDSKYVILGITEWIFNWQKNNWKNSANKPVLNKELWLELHLLTEQFNVKWYYVAGHNNDKYNERADEIATNFADGNAIELKKGEAV